MRVEVAKLNEQPFKLSEDIDAKNWELDSFDIKFIKNIHINCEFKRLGRTIFAHCRVLTHRLIICSRCLEECEQEVSNDFDLSYSISSVGDYLDIDNDLRQELLLNFPMKVLCKPDCRGICPGCGVNLNLQECKCERQVSGCKL